MGLVVTSSELLFLINASSLETPNHVSAIYSYPSSMTHRHTVDSTADLRLLDNRVMMQQELTFIL